jgi:hypothetical protein
VVFVCTLPEVAVPQNYVCPTMFWGPQQDRLRFHRLRLRLIHKLYSRLSRIVIFPLTLRSLLPAHGGTGGTRAPQPPLSRPAFAPVIPPISRMCKILKREFPVIEAKEYSPGRTSIGRRECLGAEASQIPSTAATGKDCYVSTRR